MHSTLPRQEDRRLIATAWLVAALLPCALACRSSPDCKLSYNSPAPSSTEAQLVKQQPQQPQIASAATSQSPQAAPPQTKSDSLNATARAPQLAAATTQGVVQPVGNKRIPPPQPGDHSAPSAPGGEIAAHGSRPVEQARGLDVGSQVERVEYRAPPTITPPNNRPGTPSSRPLGRDPLYRGGIPTLSERLRIPPEVPGADAPKLHLPPRDPDHPELTYPIVDKLFPELPQVWPLAIPTPSAQRPAVTLDQLQQLAFENNPELVQARADITSQFGDAVQAGTHPNPTVGYEADTVTSSKSRDYQGVYFTQWIKTAGKLSLARAVKNYDVMNAQLALRRTRVAVMAQIKARYFAVLVAQENVVVSSALVRFTDEVYRIQTEKLKAGWAAAFEPAQLRSLADQAKVLQVQAQNRYIAAWKQLAATLGLPQMPPAPLEGRADMPIPIIAFESALDRMLTVHPDVHIGRNMESQARVALRLAQLTPVPDVYLYGTFQKDFTTPNYINTSYNMQLGVPLPLWDRNKGGIVSASGDLMRASQQMRRAQNELTAQLADAFERYETSRIQLQYYRFHILPDLARAYRGVYERHQQEPEEVGFEGVIVAQQNLANAIATYIATLNSQWTAVADLANLMQVEDFNELNQFGNAIAPPPAAPNAPATPDMPAAPRIQPGGKPSQNLPAPNRERVR